MNFGLCSTLAWYQAATATPSVTNSTKEITTVSSATSGNLTFEFTLATSNTPTLTDTSGYTYIYDANVTAADFDSEPYPVPIKVDAALNEIFGTMTISLSSIKINGAGDDVKGVANTMKSFAGTYNFEIYKASGNGVMDLASPSAASDVGGWDGNDKAIKVVVGADGSVALQTAAGAALTQFYFGVRGQASIEASSASTFGVKVLD